MIARRVSALVITVCCVLLLADDGAFAQYVDERAIGQLSGAEFPPQDLQILQHQQKGLGIAAAAAQLRAGTADPKTLQLLLSQRRIDDALNALAQIVARGGPELRAALELIVQNWFEFRDQARGHVQTLQPVIERARALLASRSREEAAHLAWQLLVIERQIAGRSNDTWALELKDFATRYEGT